MRPARSSRAACLLALAVSLSLPADELITSAGAADEVVVEEDVDNDDCEDRREVKAGADRERGLC